MPNVEMIPAGPTKRFFVDMLTRDISLEDAILDLLDNCTDGVLRQLDGHRKKQKPYEGYWAKINLSADKFSILDNCGGIPHEIARESAFMLGRPDPERDEHLETVGMYGIGMKRAIFKMGRECSVVSQPDDEPYRVEITPRWFAEDDNWLLPMVSDSRGLDENGTEITITRLLSTVSQKFDETSANFVSDFRDTVSRLYAMIIEKGFQVFVNEKEIAPVDLTILAPRIHAAKTKESVSPFVFKGQMNGVDIEVVVGFWRKPATTREIDEETEQRRSTSDAGWTVVVNDRVVVYADKTRLTGWGTATVPSFHNQFMSIAGVVQFRSTNSLNLPLNTTKRGLDTSSPVYLFTLDVMREGVKYFTDFTNKWKGSEDEAISYFEKLHPTRPTETVAGVPKDRMVTARRLQGGASGRKLLPNLPMPQAKSSDPKIIFSRSTSQIRVVSNFLFGEPDIHRSEVGARCFDDTLKRAKK